MIKKLAAFLTAVVMCASFAACSSKDNSSNSSDSSSASDGSSTDIQADLIGEETILMTNNGEAVPYDLFRYYFMNIRYTMDKGQTSIWDTLGYDDEAVMFLKEYVVEQIKLHYAVSEKFNELGLSLNPEDKAQIDTYISSIKESEDYTYEDFLEYNYLTDELFREILENDLKYSAINEHLYGEDGVMHDAEEDIYKEFVLNNYVHCNHILISFDHFADDEAYAEATEEELKVAAKELADDLYQRVIDGEDLYALSQEYGDDPGVIDNEDGYTFTYDTMVQEFEDASFALEINGVSEPVETSYGYHVIQKLEISNENMIKYAFQTYMQMATEEVELTLSDEFNSMSATAIA